MIFKKSNNSIIDIIIDADKATTSPFTKLLRKGTTIQQLIKIYNNGIPRQSRI